jgi:hypothetical protein
VRAEGTTGGGELAISIYATWLTIGDDEHTPSCAKYRLLGEYPLSRAFTVDGAAMWADGEGGNQRVYARVPDASCTCGNPAPLVYQGSHVNPALEDPRGGSLSVAAIPNFCHPSVRGTGSDGGPPVEFLRVDAAEHATTYHGGVPGYATVVLERAQVEKFRDCLTQWLESEERF